jgi:hypothetical protein
MLVSEECIIERIEVEEREVYQNSSGVQLRYNQTNPSIIRDGVDGIAVIDEGEDNYRVDFWGYAYGRLYITAEGVEELGQKLISDDDAIPSWTLDPETIDAGDPPWWIPDSVEVDPTVTCDNCAETVSVRDIVTPKNLPPGMDGPVVCQACWERQ